MVISWKIKCMNLTLRLKYVNYVLKDYKKLKVYCFLMSIIMCFGHENRFLRQNCPDNRWIYISDTLSLSFFCWNILIVGSFL